MLTGFVPPSSGCRHIGDFRTTTGSATQTISPADQTSNREAPDFAGPDAPIPRFDTHPPPFILQRIKTSADKLPKSKQLFQFELERSLVTSGFRTTRQRKEVFDVVAGSYDHPTADEIFDRAKKRIPEISFATVYNCLSVLVRCGLVRQVTLDRSPTRFCPNMREHCHFFCEECGQVTDIDLPSRGAIEQVPLPSGFKVATFDISLRGVCPKCGKAAKVPRRSR
jgi:Fe2+ or Zn2+ uptake regulation protein